MLRLCHGGSQAAARWRRRRTSRPSSWAPNRWSVPGPGRPRHSGRSQSDGRRRRTARGARVVRRPRRLFTAGGGAGPGSRSARPPPRPSCRPPTAACDVPLRPRLRARTTADSETEAGGGTMMAPCARAFRGHTSPRARGACPGPRPGPSRRGATPPGNATLWQPAAGSSGS